MPDESAGAIELKTCRTKQLVTLGFVFTRGKLWIFSCDAGQLKRPRTSADEDITDMVLANISLCMETSGTPVDHTLTASKPRS